jgi:hypothetical protein
MVCRGMRVAHPFDGPASTERPHSAQEMHLACVELCS